MSLTPYKRKYLRIKPDVPLYGVLRIVEIGGRKVSTGTAKIRILDISPGGLRFVSSLRFPAGRGMIIEVSFMIEGASYCLKGFVVRACGTEINEYEYGFCFLKDDENLRKSLKQLFKKMLVRLNKHIVILRIG